MITLYKNTTTGRWEYRPRTGGLIPQHFPEVRPDDTNAELVDAWFNEAQSNFRLCPKCMIANLPCRLISSPGATYVQQNTDVEVTRLGTVCFDFVYCGRNCGFSSLRLNTVNSVMKFAPLDALAQYTQDNVHVSRAFTPSSLALMPPEVDEYRLALSDRAGNPLVSTPAIHNGVAVFRLSPEGFWLLQNASPWLTAVGVASDIARGIELAARRALFFTDHEFYETVAVFPQLAKSQRQNWQRAFGMTPEIEIVLHQTPPPQKLQFALLAIPIKAIKILHNTTTASTILRAYRNLPVFEQPLAVGHELEARVIEQILQSVITAAHSYYEWPEAAPAWWEASREFALTMKIFRPAAPPPDKQAFNTTQTALLGALGTRATKLWTPSN